LENGYKVIYITPMTLGRYIKKGRKKIRADKKGPAKPENKKTGTLNGSGDPSARGRNKKAPKTTNRK